MKKTLLALAFLGAFAGTAAADVTLYGSVDYGFAYKHIDSDVAGTDATDTFSMESGQQAGSRWGLRGREDLGNGYAVGFILENGFTGDDGQLGQGGRLFGREASVSLYSPYGQLSLGRIGSINQGTSSWGKIGMISAFGTNYGSYAAQAGTTFKTSQVWDNTIAYQTPEFAGVKVYAQYSMGSSNSTNGYVENESSTDRYYVIGATYENGPFAGYLAVDSTNYRSYNSGARPITGSVDDSLTVTLGGSYDFGVAKVFLAGQYFEESDFTPIGFSSALRLDGYGVQASASIPALGGKFLVGVGYTDAESADSQTVKYDFSRIVGSVGYDVFFTKRTDVYAVATYMQESVEQSSATDLDPKAYAVMVGLRHRF
ncbi:porin [Sutterella sp.]|uniref:porin n=1 Tax=Sutterella sp. TaxID=1981025 RepID=UPI0026DFB52B|nr:porin [Sutterella sp.]MDO5532817.1 porin [Sutterella sp.]